jgi:3-phosphoshikimate 1-carboxyvinyltransferase
MGAAVEIERGPLEAGEAVGTVRVRGGALSGIAIGPELVPHVIDELPVIAVIATQAVGLTRITGASELRVKESDRIQAVVDALRSLGARIRELEDGMEIEGPVALAGGQVSAGGDHRMAMALAVAGLLATEPVEIEGSDTVDISYPEFWQDLESLL